MADSSIAITAGSGTSVDTRTEGTNSEHRQVVVIGDPSTNAGVAPVDSTNGLAVDIKTISGGNLPGSLVDDAAFTPATSRVLPIGAEADDTTPDSVDEGDIGAIRMSTNRNLYIRIRDNAGNERGANVDASGNLNVIAGANSGVDIGDVDVTSVVPGTGATNLGKAEDAAHTTGDVGVMALALRDDTLDIRSGTENDYEPLHTDSQGALWVHPTDTVAHDAVDAGSPIKIGGIALGSQQSAVAASDRVNLAHDRHGNAYVRTGNQAPSGSIWTAIHVPAANTQATANKAAAGAGVRNVVTEFSATIVGGTTAPSAVNVVLNIIDGASGGTTYLKRVQMALPATAGELRGIAMSNLWLPGTANTATTIEFSAAGGANTTESVSMSGVTITE